MRVGTAGIDAHKTATAGVHAMTSIVRHLRMGIVGLVFSVLMTCQAFAQSCTSTADCGGTGICSQGFLFFPGECVSFACRNNRECSNLPELPVCRQGQCQARTVSGGSASSGRGISPGGAGGACGPITLGGGITKNIGCRPGLQCRFGVCDKLAQ